MRFLDRANLREIAREQYSEHKKFVDFMYPHFGFREHPGYAKVIMRKPFFFPGAVGMFEGELVIFLDEAEFRDGSGRLNQMKIVNWHESGHILHSRINPYYLEDRQNAEEVAELGALIFLDLTEGINVDSLKKYGLDDPKGLSSWVNYEGTQSVIEIAKKKKDLLKAMATPPKGTQFSFNL